MSPVNSRNYSRSGVLTPEIQNNKGALNIIQPYQNCGSFYYVILKFKIFQLDQVLSHPQMVPDFPLFAFDIVDFYTKRFKQLMFLILIIEQYWWQKIANVRYSAFYHYIFSVLSQKMMLIMALNPFPFSNCITCLQISNPYPFLMIYCCTTISTA